MWLANTNDTRTYVVAGVASATSLTITPVYAGANVAGQSYFLQNPTAGLTTYYSAGTTTFTPGSTAVTGSGTSWNSGMIGSWIYGSNNPAVLYKIIAVGSPTTLTISPAYK